MIFRDLSTKISLKLLSLLILIMSLPWFIAYVTSATFRWSYVFLLDGLPLGVISALFALIPLIGVIYGCIITIFSDVYSHLRAFVYAHGIFTSISSLTLLMTFAFTKWNRLVRYPMSFSIPFQVTSVIYSLLYLIYAILAYSSLARIISNHCRKPFKEVLYYWKVNAAFGLLLSVILILITISSIGTIDTTFIIYSIVFILVLMVLSIDELFFDGRLRKIRYPLLIPLLTHTSWMIAVLPRVNIPIRDVLLAFLFTPPLPGLTTSIGQDHTLTAEMIYYYHIHVLRIKDVSQAYPNTLLALFGFWLFLEFLAFYRISTFTTIGKSIIDILKGVLGKLRSTFLFRGGRVKVELKAYSDYTLAMLIVNDIYSELIGLEAYVIGADWIPLDKPIRLVFEPDSLELRLAPGQYAILDCYDWSGGGIIQANEMLAIKIICKFKEGHKVESVHTVSIYD